MKNHTIFSGALAVLFLVLIGCSGCDSSDPWAKLPKDCEAMVISAKKRTLKAVPCSGPIDAKTLINESRSEHEARFGGPYKKLAEKDKPNQVFYNGGSIMIWYETTNPTEVFRLEVYPENLDFNPQAILDFMSINDMTVTYMAEGSPVYGYTWRDDPSYPTLTGDSWVGKKPDKVYRIEIYGANRL